MHHYLSWWLGAVKCHQWCDLVQLFADAVNKENARLHAVVPLTQVGVLRLLGNQSKSTEPVVLPSIVGLHSGYWHAHRSVSTRSKILYSANFDLVQYI
jgi:hypothetical protein